MSYYIIKSYSKDITEENFMLEMMDLKDNRWLINYGMHLITLILRCMEKKNYSLIKIL